MTRLIDRQSVRHLLNYTNEQLDRAIAAGVIPPPRISAGLEMFDELAVNAIAECLKAHRASQLHSPPPLSRKRVAR